MELNISLDEYRIKPNGVIHIGSDKGQMASYYHSQGVHKVMWIDKDFMKYRELYQTSAAFAMEQLYYTADLGFTNDKMTFKNLWREYSVQIDIETYDLLCLDISADSCLAVLNGFEDFLKPIQNILIRPDADSLVESKLAEEGFVKIVQTDTVIIYEGQKVAV